ncbi:NAD-dependent epimerase/dehydratase family protein [candidate division WOR-3 bacterium]|uniref:NAD-dependent epimerase/dehydratase family protein n=1 Tax=candidate division WOR-3 bacterium TaxID=2052148 RepID=A0A9D5K9W5_UNCW3|nr:NAD-dependent epimerase/dehydratase family protein [candidate division WOR-3 bacterium]MBD3365163.1 NAD-dependent epimerase/dehydratase family protein [candidate division WOR-3 bacterium]
MNSSEERILISGASGFVGNLLAEAETRRGRKVFGIHDPNESPDLSFESRGVDLRSHQDVSEYINEKAPFNCVYHLAALSSVRLCQENPELCFSVNATGTLNLLNALSLLEDKPKILFTSTCEVYGKVDPVGKAIKETDIPEPANIYGLSKLTAEAICQYFIRERGLSIVISRGFNHTGSGQRSSFVFPHVARTLARIEKGEIEPVIKMGNLSVKRDFADARDVVQAYIMMMDNASSGSIYNVTSECYISIEEGVKMMVEISGLHVNIIQEQSRMRSYDIPGLHGDASSIGKDLGWRASITPEETMEDLVEHWREKEGIK